MISFFIKENKDLFISLKEDRVKKSKDKILLRIQSFMKIKDKLLETTRVYEEMQAICEDESE